MHYRILRDAWLCEHLWIRFRAGAGWHEERAFWCQVDINHWLSAVKAEEADVAACGPDCAPSQRFPAG